MLFLGAGASKPFGIGDLKGLTTEADKVIEEEGYLGLLRTIRDKLTNTLSSHIPIDMEVVLSVFDYLSQPSFDKIGPAGAFLMPKLEEIKSLSNIPSRKAYLKIRNRIEKTIVKSCMSCNFGKALRYYSKLFQTDITNSTEYVNSTGDPLQATRIFSRAATTNYDLILERYDFNDIHPPIHFLQRCFEHYGYEWNVRIFNPNKTKNAIYLKLHGSIDWWKRERDNATVYSHYSTTLLGDKYKHRVMIYPIYGKPNRQEPYVSLYEEFRKHLQFDPIFVCIGYSFRDSAINEAFSSALNGDPSKRMILINTRNSRRAIRKRLNGFPTRQFDYIDTECQIDTEV